MDQKSSIDYNPDLAVAEARSYLGCKWRHRGRGRFGIDCIGLVVAAVTAGGFPIVDRRDYGREPWKDGLDGEIRDRFGEPVNDWQPGDVAMMRWENRPDAGHVGIIGRNENGLTLIHCHSMSAVVEHGIDAYWRRLIIGVFRP